MGTSNSLDKDNEMNTSLINESAIINTEKGDIILSKTTKTSLQIESSIRNKENPDITLSPSKNDQSKDPNPNEKNASINQSSSLKENTDVVSTSSEAAKKNFVSDPLLKSTNNSSQTKFTSDPSIKICPNPSFVPNLNHNHNPNPNPNEKNAVTNQSSGLKENTDIVSTSSEAAKKSILSYPLLKSTNNSSQTKSTSDPSDKIPPNPSFFPNLNPNPNPKPNPKPNPNEKNAVTNQSSRLKGNTDVVSTSSEIAKKVLIQIRYSNLQIIHHKQNLYQNRGHPILQTKLHLIHLLLSMKIM